MPAARPMLRPSHVILLLVCALTVVAGARARGDDLRREISFRNDVMEIKATATFSDGSRRDVSNLAVYEQSTDLAKITPGGQVRRERNGEMTVIVRYLNLQQPVRLAFVPARRDFVWRPVAARNYI